MNKIKIIDNHRYKFDPNDFKKFTKWDKYKYTRNLVHEGNSKFNLILMCWPESVSSAVHDHADSHCFMRILAGEENFYEMARYRKFDGKLNSVNYMMTGS